MEYVIMVVGLLFVAAAWDGMRRAINASDAKGSAVQRIDALTSRVTTLETSLIVTRNHLAEMKSFVASGGKSRR
jgi:hypothetical protein